MKENNKSKFAMNIFHQARKHIALIAGLLGQYADKQWTQICDLVWIAYSASVCESSFLWWKICTLKKSSYAAYKNISGGLTCYFFDSALM